jgi:hypothetical protein
VINLLASLLRALARTLSPEPNAVISTAITSVTSFSFGVFLLAPAGGDGGPFFAPVGGAGSPFFARGVGCDSFEIFSLFPSSDCS